MVSQLQFQRVILKCLGKKTTKEGSSYRSNVWYNRKYQKATFELGVI